MTNDEQRFVDIYDRHYRNLYSYCLRRSSYDDVEDIVAAVFLSAWRKIDQVPTGEEALYWLYRVAWRTISNKWRSTKRHRRLVVKLGHLGTVPETPPEDYLVQDEESKQIIEAAMSLKPVDREVIFLALWEQLPHVEIAGIVEISPDAVKQRLYRAKQNLADEYNRRFVKNRSVPTAQEGGAW